MTSNSPENVTFLTRMNNTTLLNSKPFKIKFRNGLQDLINVRELSIRQLYEFVELVSAGNTPQLVALCCDRNGEWVDSLDFDSYCSLAKECWDQNFPSAVALAQRDATVGLKIAPLLTKVSQLLAESSKLMTKFPQILPAGSAPSQEPSPSASAGASGSESSI